MDAKNSSITLKRIDLGIEGLNFPRIDLNASGGQIILSDNKGTDIFHVGADTAGMRIGPISKGNKGGSLRITKASGQQTILLDGDAGDILLSNADCAEEFDVSSSKSEEIEPGTVMIIGNDRKLQKSLIAYDKRVVGVISGGGDLNPGLY